MRLFYGNTLGKVSRFVGIVAPLYGTIVGKKLGGNDRKEW
jgi:hypothetical protein